MSEGTFHLLYQTTSAARPFTPRKVPAPRPALSYLNPVVFSAFLLCLSLTQKPLNVLSFCPQILHELEPNFHCPPYR